MIFGKKRVEEDLENIKAANLPHYNKNKPEKNMDSNSDLKLEKNDLLAMILAVMSLVLPYLAAFAAIMAFVVFLMNYFYK